MEKGRNNCPACRTKVSEILGFVLCVVHRFSTRVSKPNKTCRQRLQRLQMEDLLSSNDCLLFVKHSFLSVSFLSLLTFTCLYYFTDLARADTVHFCATVYFLIRFHSLFIIIEEPFVSCCDLLMLRRVYPVLTQRAVRCMTSSSPLSHAATASAPELSAGPIAVTASDPESQRATKKAKTESLKKIGTHNGTFHCDEALAVFLLRLTSKYKDASTLHPTTKASRGQEPQ
jgi:hypothetical protein